MENKLSLPLVIALLVVAGLTGFQAGRHAMPPAAHPVSHADMTMDEMTEGLRGKTGAEFDRAFVEMMIVHHEGAVEMARLIPAQAEHPELKALGLDIISAQTREIEMMKQWLRDWESAAQGEGHHMAN